MGSSQKASPTYSLPKDSKPAQVKIKSSGEGQKVEKMVTLPLLLLCTFAFSSAALGLLTCAKLAAAEQGCTHLHQTGATQGLTTTFTQSTTQGAMEKRLGIIGI